MAKGAGKLTEDEQYQVCKWFGEFKTPIQVMALIKSQFGKTLAHKNVWAYANGANRKKWKPLIERLRQEWALGIMDIPLAHKRARVEKLVLLLGQAERNATVSEYARINQCLSVLRELRDEMEAGKAEFTNVYMTTIHHYSDEEILKQRDLVLARLKQLGGGHGVRRGGEETDGTIEVEARPVTGGAPGTDDAPAGDGGDGSGGGSHQRPDGESHQESPPSAGVLDAREDGTSPQSASPAQGPQ